MDLMARPLQGCVLRMQGSLRYTVGAQPAVLVVILPRHAVLV